VAGAILPAEFHTPAERFYARHNILSQDFVLAHPFMPYAQTANAAFRREVFQQIGSFDEVMITCEDADLIWRMQMHSRFRLCYRPEALVWHRHRSSGSAMLKQTIGWGLGQALVYRKHQHLMRRDSWPRLAADYRRIAGLTKLTVGRWLSVRSGRQETEALEDAYLSLIFFAGIKLGRLKGSVRGRVFYP
jgi:GT2 family glycosyltransferase